MIGAYRKTPAQKRREARRRMLIALILLAGVAGALVIEVWFP
jgi:hypothetical protein